MRLCCFAGLHTEALLLLACVSFCRWCLVLHAGLVNSTAMNVRRTPNPSALQLSSLRKEAVKTHLFRYAAGLSLDLARGEDSSIYFVSTDDGVVHKCSLNYNEQFLSTYYGHKGPIRTVGIYIYIYIYICMYVCIYIYIYTYLHIYVYAYV